MYGKLIQAIGITVMLYVVMEIDRMAPKLAIPWTSSQQNEAPSALSVLPVRSIEQLAQPLVTEQ